MIIAAPEELFQWFLGRSFRRSVGDRRRRVVESEWRVSSWKPPRPGPGRVWTRISPPPAAPGASPIGTPWRRRPPPPAEKSLGSGIRGRFGAKTSGASSMCWGGWRLNTEQRPKEPEKKKKEYWILMDRDEFDFQSNFSM